MSGSKSVLNLCLLDTASIHCTDELVSVQFRELWERYEYIALLILHEKVRRKPVTNHWITHSGQ